MRKLLLLGAASLLMAACSESVSAPTPQRTPGAKASHDDTSDCRSGYVIAYDENGNPYCVPE